MVFQDVNGNWREEPWIVLWTGMTLHGTVLDDDAKPVVGARVGRIGAYHWTYTDSHGNFALEHWPTLGQDGRRAYVERSPKVESDDIVEQWCREPLEQADNVMLQVYRGGVIEGRITEFSTGTPVARVWVRGNTMQSQVNQVSTHTDEDGRYRLRTYAGKVRVQIMPPQPQMRKPPLDGRQWTPTEPVKNVELATAEHIRDVDFVLRAAVKVTGIVRTVDGEVPPVPLRVDISKFDETTQMGHGFAVVTTKPDGSFELDQLPAGRFNASVSTLEHQPLGGMEFEIDKWEDFLGLEIMLSGNPELIEALARAADKVAAAKEIASTKPATQGNAILRGRVVNVAGEPVRMARVFAIDTEATENPRQYIPDECHADLNGEFELKRGERTHALFVYAWDPRKEFGCVVRLEPGWADAPQELRLSQQTSRITGIVRDETTAPMPGIPVRFFSRIASAVDRTWRESVVLATVTDENGRYEITGFVSPLAEIGLRLSTNRRESEMYGIGESHGRGINDRQAYGIFPVKPGETLGDMDFIQDRSKATSVEQRVTREDLADRRER